MNYNLWQGPIVSVLDHGWRLALAFRMNVESGKRSDAKRLHQEDLKEQASTAVTASIRQLVVKWCMYFVCLPGTFPISIFGVGQLRLD